MLKFKELMEEDEGYIYSIKRKELIPFKKEIIKSYDNDYFADAKFIVNTIEDVHPYFLTEFYNLKEYIEARETFLEKCKNTSLIDFKFRMLQYFKILSDGHMSVMPLGNYELNIEFDYINNFLYLKGTQVKVSKIGGIEIKKILKKIDNYFYFENLSNKELYIAKYLREKLFLEYIGCTVLDNKIEILTETNSVIYEFINKEIKNLVDDYDISLANYTIKSNIINNTLFYIDFKECIVNNELYTVANNIKQAISNGIKTFIVDVRENMGGTDKATEILLNALDIKMPTNGVIIRLSNDIKKQVINNYNFNDVDKYEINYVVYKPNLSVTKKNNNIKLFLLTSKYTYSSAMLLALGISDGNLGTIVGEIPSNAPSCFGDMYCTETLRLKIPFKVSHKYFIRPNLKKEIDNLVPNIEIESENALNKVLKCLT